MGPAVFAFCAGFAYLIDTGEVRCWGAGLRHRSMQGMLDLLDDLLPAAWFSGTGVPAVSWKFASLLICYTI